MHGWHAFSFTGGHGEKNLRLPWNFSAPSDDPEEKALPATPWTLAATAEATRASGFYRLAGTEVRRLLFKDKQVGGLIKARNAATEGVMRGMKPGKTNPPPMNATGQRRE